MTALLKSFDQSGDGLLDTKELKASRDNESTQQRNHWNRDTRTPSIGVELTSREFAPDEAPSRHKNHKCMKHEVKV